MAVVTPVRPVVPPPPVLPGAQVGVAAISGAVEPDVLRRGLRALAELGFEPTLGTNVERRELMLAGSDSERLAGLYELAENPRLEAVFFARGGYGSTRLLPAINWRRLAKHPKAYVGYSDLTPFLNVFCREVGVSTLHGPMIAGDFARGLGAAEQESLKHALAGGAPSLPLADAVGTGPVSGPLVGGCLSMLVATLGTPWAPDLDGAILFWEDVNEPLYRIDRMLTHLRLSGSLARIRGMVVGETAPSDAEDFAAGAFEQLLGSLSIEFGWPVGWGLQSGHGCPNLTLPLGRTATFDPYLKRLNIEQA